MKKYFSIITLFALILSASSCKKGYLDINENTNSATSSTPNLVLPAALTNTATNLVYYNYEYGNWLVGYQANAGGYSFTGSTYFTYLYNGSTNSTVFTTGYSLLNNYEYIVKESTGVEKYVLFNSVARIMKAFHYQMLVDEYGDIPYSEALKGSDNVTPHYDDAATIYKSLVTELDASIAQLKAYSSNTAVTALGKSDVMFGGDLTKWIKFANNIKLRILIRAQDSPILSSFVSTAFGTFSSEGFLTDDVLINPTYATGSANMNPLWTLYHTTYSGTSITSYGQSRIPTKFIFSYYNGTKLSDATRGALTYKNYATPTPTNQLGNETSVSTYITGYPAWYIGTGTAANAVNTTGLLKGRTMGQIIMPAAETYFLLAEAALKGHTLSGDAKTNFNNGIEASYKYLSKDYTNTSSLTQANLDSYLTAYIAANAAATGATTSLNYLVDWDKTGSPLSGDYNTSVSARKLEAIITQKYIALNWINGYEAWQEYKRTGYPYIVKGSTSATASFASLQSAATTTDKLPVRLLYPTDEYNLNPNVPAQKNQFTDKIFWDVNSN